TITVEGSRLSCAWHIQAEGDPVVITFAPELNLTLLAGDAPDRYYRIKSADPQPPALEDRRMLSRGEITAGDALELVNEWDKFLVRVSAAPAAPLWRFPLETASQSEGGFERTYQASVILPLWRGLSLGSFEARVTVEIESF